MCFSAPEVLWVPFHNFRLFINILILFIYHFLISFNYLSINSFSSLSTFKIIPMSVFLLGLFLSNSLFHENGPYLLISLFALAFFFLMRIRHSEYLNVVTLEIRFSHSSGIAGLCLFGARVICL